MEGGEGGGARFPPSTISGSLYRRLLYAARNAVMGLSPAPVVYSSSASFSPREFEICRGRERERERRPKSALMAIVRVVLAAVCFLRGSTRTWESLSSQFRGTVARRLRLASKQNLVPCSSVLGPFFFGPSSLPSGYLLESA